MSWMGVIGVDVARFMNVSNRPTPSNRKLKVSEYELERLENHVSPWLGDITVIALGKPAADALRRLKIECVELPYPSGPNRKLNDKKFIDGELKRCAEYVAEKDKEFYEFIGGLAKDQRPL